MADIPKAQGDVLRRNAEHECGTPIGQMGIKVHGLPDIQVVSFYCNQPRLHTDQCMFTGQSLIVKANRAGSPLILNAPYRH
jgi:hypothetical protein